LIDQHDCSTSCQLSSSLTSAVNDELSGALGSQPPDKIFFTRSVFPQTAADHIPRSKSISSRVWHTDVTGCRQQLHVSKPWSDDMLKRSIFNYFIKTQFKKKHEQSKQVKNGTFLEKPELGNSKEYVFYARKQYASRVFAIVWASVRLSVCLSVRPSVTLVSCIKTVQARITKSSPWTAPRSLVYRDKISCHWVQGFPSNEGVEEGYPP